MHPYVGYANTCRICLKKDEHMKLTIFDMLNDTIAYCDMLTMVLHPVPIDINPKLPQNLCQMCKDNLVKVYNLRQLCFTSDRWIKSTIYGDVYLNANGYTLAGGCSASNGVSSIETMIIDSDDDQPSTNSNLVSSFHNSTLNLIPEILLQDNSIESDPVKEHCSIGQSAKVQHSCELCRRKFSTLNGYLRHKSKKHTDEYKCELSTNAIETITVENEHSIEHPCEICPRKFTTRKGYLRHKLKAHKEEYKCELCCVAYNSSKGLQSHLASIRHSQKIKVQVSTDGDYACQKCCIGFTCIKEYSKHMLKHMVIRMDLNNFVCQVCGRWYSTIYSLKRHREQMNHTNGAN